MASRPAISRGQRTLRGIAVAGFATLLASLAHTIGGGAAPGMIAIAVSLAFSLPLAVLLARNARPWRTVLSALIAQATLHVFYSLGTGGAVAVPNGAGHVHDPLAGLDALGLAVAQPHPAHTLMLGAHLAAAALTILALLRADAAFDAIARVVLASIARTRIAPVALPIRRPLVAPAAGPQLPHASLATLSRLRHRGPPVTSLAH